MDVKKIANVLENKPDLLVRQIVLDTAGEKDQIIYGARATNVQLPQHLRKQTEDYDILTKKPKKSALELTKKLNRAVGREEFKVVPAKHKGTYKIKYKGETVVDYTQLKRIPKVKNVFGTNYYNIKSTKRNVQRLVKNPAAEFRREKDVSTLDRIKEFERIEKAFNF